MNVLADKHHAGLFHSIQLLGQRLGWTVYTPTERGWWDEGYWAFGRSTYNDDRLAAQFLDALPGPDGEFPDWDVPTVTLGEARSMDWAYVIASVPDNEQGFARFAREMGAQYVVQVGNTGQFVDWSLDPLALVSSEMPILGRGITYHQEMDPVAFVPPHEVASGSRLRWAGSFVNCMTSMGACYDLLPSIVDVYGIDGPMGVIKPYSELVRLMGLYRWGWHDKAQGDGFGHVIHSWAAVGRPLVGHAAHYSGKMGSVFWTPATSIDLAMGIDAAVDTIRSISPAVHSAMCHAIRDEFDKIDYDGEAEAIADFLGVRVTA